MIVTAFAALLRGASVPARLGMVARRRLALSVALVAASACRREPPPEGVADAAAAAPPSATSDSPLEEPAASAPSGQAAHEVDPRATSARGDAGLLDPACGGASLSLLGAVVDARCAATDREWAHAGDAGGATSLRQEAAREGSSDRVLFALVNGGTTPLVVPLRFRPGRPDLPAFSVLAESETHAIFELAAPGIDDIAADAGVAGAIRVHSARIRISPGGAARVRLVLDRHVVRRVDPPCPDASPCGAPSLPPGRYTLYVGQLLSSLDAGPPARLAWEIAH